MQKWGHRQREVHRNHLWNFPLSILNSHEIMNLNRKCTCACHARQHCSLLVHRTFSSFFLFLSLYLPLHLYYHFVWQFTHMHTHTHTHTLTHIHSLCRCNWVASADWLRNVWLHSGTFSTQNHMFICDGYSLSSAQWLANWSNLSIRSCFNTQTHTRNI